MIKDKYIRFMKESAENEPNKDTSKKPIDNISTKLLLILVVFTFTSLFCSVNSVLFTNEFISEQLISFFFTVKQNSFSCEELTLNIHKHILR